MVTGTKETWAFLSPQNGRQPISDICTSTLCKFLQSFCKLIGTIRVISFYRALRPTRNVVAIHNRQVGNDSRLICFSSRVLWRCCGRSGYYSGFARRRIPFALQPAVRSGAYSFYELGAVAPQRSAGACIGCSRAIVFGVQPPGSAGIAVLYERPS